MSTLRQHVSFALLHSVQLWSHDLTISLLFVPTKRLCACCVQIHLTRAMSSSPNCAQLAGLAAMHIVDLCSYADWSDSDLKHACSNVVKYGSGAQELQMFRPRLKGNSRVVSIDLHGSRHEYLLPGESSHVIEAFLSIVQTFLCKSWTVACPA